jgi:REP element-mobilizing transposase RayT
VHENPRSQKRDLGHPREAIFFEDGDHEIYCDMLAEQLRKSSVEVWAYCLMPDHVHLILEAPRAPHPAKQSV